MARKDPHSYSTDTMDTSKARRLNRLARVERSKAQHRNSQHDKNMNRGADEAREREALAQLYQELNK